MAWAALTGPMPRRSVRPGARSLTMVCSWARLALSVRAASRRARARRRISAWRTACSRLASRGGRRRARPARGASVSAPRASWRSVSSPPSSSARSRLVCAVLVVVSLLAGAEQDPQRFAVAVGARGGQPVGVQAQRGQHGQVGVDRVGLALAAAGLAVGLLALEHQQAGGGGGAGQPDAVAAGALDGDDQPRPGGVVDDPGQQLGVAGGVVADRGRWRSGCRWGGRSRPGGCRGGCRHRRRRRRVLPAWAPAWFLPGERVNGRHRPGWESPSGTSVTGHARRADRHRTCRSRQAAIVVGVGKALASS